MNAVDTLRREIRMKKANDTKIPLQEDIPNPNCMTEYDNRKFSRYKSKCYVEQFLRVREICQPVCPTAITSPTGMPA
jgi:hypothetical protein